MKTDLYSSKASIMEEYTPFLCDCQIYIHTQFSIHLDCYMRTLEIQHFALALKVAGQRLALTFVTAMRTLEIQHFALALKGHLTLKQ